MKYFLFLSLLFHSGIAKAQLFESRDIKAAYANGTRNKDGQPGKNYWQNHAAYNITITALPPDRVIKGKETIVYYNDSPDTLRNMNMKLFLNIHKPGAARDGGAADDYLTPGVNITEALANGKKIKIPPSSTLGTNVNLRMPEAVMPHSTVSFDFTWDYTISLQSGREGMIDSTTWFFAYFYPRIAVYDDYNGWDRMPFVDSHEFYSDFNDYTVTLNVPDNFIVTGTGTLQEPGTLLQPSFLKKYQEAMQSDATINIVTKEDLAAKNITVHNTMNSWQFKATNIPDMAFAMSDHYNWDGSSVLVDDAAKRRAAAYAFYDDKSKDYHFVSQQARHALNWFSHNWPGVPYPYEKTTVVQGFAGMEYPMMANDESYPDTTFSAFVAEHEIAHTYMPFYMGINETRYGFMDEGWATTFENLIANSDMGEKKATEFYKQFRVNSWIYSNASSGQIPIITPGDQLSGSGLGQNEYGKASLGYLAMKSYLGDAMFKKCLQGYMNRWHGKHPNPWDFFYSFNDIAGKDLNWFWRAWFFEPTYIDLSLRSAKKSTTGYVINIENIGGMPAPVTLVVSYTDGSTESFEETPAIWQQNIKMATVNLNTKKKIKSITTEGGIWVDANLKDNNLQL